MNREEDKDFFTALYKQKPDQVHETLTTVCCDAGSEFESSLCSTAVDDFWFSAAQLHISSTPTSTYVTTKTLQTHCYTHGHTHNVMSHRLSLVPVNKYCGGVKSLPIYETERNTFTEHRHKLQSTYTL